MGKHESAYDSKKIKNWSRKHSQECEGISVRRIRMFPFPSISTYDLVKTRLLGVGSKRGRINPSQCTFP